MTQYLFVSVAEEISISEEPGPAKRVAANPSNQQQAVETCSM